MIPYSRLCCTVYAVKMLRESLILLSYIGTAGNSYAETTPISENTKIRLQTVVDGLDVRCEGFAALVEHVENWEGENTSSASPNWELFEESPQSCRGNMFTVSGVVELALPLSAPWEGVEELFLRNRDGIVFGLYVVGSTNLSHKKTVQTPALFYKTMFIEGRDNQKRLYPMFVTNQSVITTSMQDSIMPVGLLALFFLVVAVFIFLKKKCTKQVNSRRTIKVQEVLDATSEIASDLPNNSSDALATMYNESEIDI